MKPFLLLSIVTLILSCSKTQKSEHKIQLIDSTLIAKYSKTITAEELKTTVYKFASAEFEGRRVGLEGQKKAANYLRDFYTKEGIASPIGDGNYFQSVPASALPAGFNDSENVLAYIKGSEKPDEVLIISGHFDHEGIKNNKIYFGADDNASGSMAILEIAQAFKLAEKEGHAPKRSILFLHLTAEEIGLYGSSFYVKNPVFALNKTIADLNIDMIGRVDPTHINTPNYIHLIGADRISKELHFVSEAVNSTFSNLELDYTFNAENDPNKYYYRSDHYNFAKHNIPVIFYFDGGHIDYHRPTDTADKINYPLLVKRAQFIFATAWQLANRDTFLKHNTAF